MHCKKAFGLEAVAELKEALALGGSKTLILC